MNILFIHQNFPGQFKHLAPALAAMRENRVKVLTPKRKTALDIPGVDTRYYEIKRSSSRGIHPWISDLETKTIRGEASFQEALTMKQEGYSPDVIIAHPGWGEALFLKEVWPDARLGIYCEYYYHFRGGDTGFDPEFGTPDPGQACRLRMKNANSILHFDIAEGAISPTRWQASTFPGPFREKISIIHDGIDTARLVPSSTVAVRLRDDLKLTRSDEVITFVNRNLEPTRGYHRFMRALPALLARRPRANVIIVGGSGLSYGARSKDGKSWKQIFIDEVRPAISDDDWQRVHFVGNLAYGKFTRLLQLSTVHVYLTYPFVLSWSLIEAMSMGCAIVASDTAPLHEVITDGETGMLVDFFDGDALVESVINLLDDPDKRRELGEKARLRAVQNFDLSTVCLPAQLRWVEEIAG